MTMRPGPIVAGLILLGLGAAMLFDTTGMTQINISRFVAPIVLIALGSAMVLGNGGFIAGYRGRDGEEEPRRHSRRRGGPFAGLWLIGIGCIMLISQTHLLGLTSHTSWPLFVVMAGVMIMLRGWR
jgi:hypothetical protein